MTSRNQGWYCRANDSLVDDRYRDLQRRGVVQSTATVLTTLHRICVLTFRRLRVATYQHDPKCLAASGHRPRLYGVSGANCLVWRAGYPARHPADGAAYDAGATECA